jgi:hypothetical protein
MGDEDVTIHSPPTKKTGRYNFFRITHIEETKRMRANILKIKLKKIKIKRMRKMTMKFAGIKVKKTNQTTIQGGIPGDNLDQKVFGASKNR